MNKYVSYKNDFFRLTLSYSIVCLLIFPFQSLVLHALICPNSEQAASWRQRTLFFYTTQNVYKHIFPFHLPPFLTSHSWAELSSFILLWNLKSLSLSEYRNRRAYQAKYSRLESSALWTERHFRMARGTFLSMVAYYQLRVSRLINLNYEVSYNL